MKVTLTRTDAAVALALVALTLPMGACVPRPIRSTIPAPPTPEQMAEFWVEPTDLASRDLFWGPGGKENAPNPAGRWEFVSRKSTGYSRGYTVTDEKGTSWSVKLGDEAQSEVVSSRLMWALGFHQTASYYVPSWTLSGRAWAGPQEAARFRADPGPGVKRKISDWSWHESPFVRTAPWAGALVFMAMINNSDLKPEQNVLYELTEPREGVQRWYVVKDLGLSLGESGMRLPKRNDVGKFERAEFISGVVDGKVKFHFSSTRKDLLSHVTPADVKWTCERLARLSPTQWQDAFRAAGYPPDVANRFIKRFQEKIAEGLKLGADGAAPVK